MDIVLEVFDTFLFDRLYANLLPAPSPTAFDAFQNGSLNTTLMGIQEVPTVYIDHGFVPASKLLSFQPSAWAYKSQWSRHNIYRQALSLYLITWLFGFVVYFAFASLSYLFVFDKHTTKHPKYLKNQMRLEIAQALRAMPTMAIFTAPFFLAEVRGYSKLYDTPADGPGALYSLLQFPLFIAFTDFCIYWIHRGLHHPLIYKRLHKPHHKWIVPTPFASHAFHPLDGFAQSLPYHVFPFVLPLQKLAYIGLFVFINIWTVLIHDGEYVANSPLINGAACHTMHHLYFNFNYGQFTTLWDRLGGSYRKPNEELFHKETKMGREEWERQRREMESISRVVEGRDDRVYAPAEEKKSL